MSRRQYAFSKEILSTARYASSTASRSVGASFVTPSTRPPLVTSLPSSCFAPAMKTLSASAYGIVIGKPVS